VPVVDRPLGNFPNSELGFTQRNKRRTVSHITLISNVRLILRVNYAELKAAIKQRSGLTKGY